MESSINQPQLSPRKDWKDLEAHKWYDITQVWKLTAENGTVNLFFQLDRSFYIMFPSCLAVPDTIEQLITRVLEPVNKIKLFIHRDNRFKIRMYKRIQ